MSHEVLLKSNYKKFQSYHQDTAISAFSRHLRGKLERLDRFQELKARQVLVCTLKMKTWRVCESFSSSRQMLGTGMLLGIKPGPHFEVFDVPAG